MGRLLFPLVAVAILTVASCSPQGGRSVDPVKAAAVRAQIDNRDFTIDVNRVVPNRFRSVSLNYPYNLRINGDSVFSYLPYFGEAYAPVLGRPEGLIFDAPLNGFKVGEGKRGSTEVSFSARSSEDRFDFRIIVFPNGVSSITVFPDRKESVSFEGELRIPDA